MTGSSLKDGDTYFVPVINGVAAAGARQVDGIKFVKLEVATWAKAANEYKDWFRQNIAQ